MKKLLESIGQWITAADAAEIASILFFGAWACCMILGALALVIHGFPVS